MKRKHFRRAIPVALAVAGAWLLGPAATNAAPAARSLPTFEVDKSWPKVPPNMMTTRGPYLSTNQASTGTSHVSTTTNRVKASWIAARPQ